MVVQACNLSIQVTKVRGSQANSGFHSESLSQKQTKKKKEKINKTHWLCPRDVHSLE
jgi:hypothetical protein